MRKEINDDFTEYSNDNEKSDMKKALMLSGIAELEEHGITDFSLRRVAGRCGASCAAPYRHFKSKNDLISEILAYVNSQWEVFSEHVYETFPGDTKKRFTEIFIAEIRFWSANPHFRYIKMMDVSGFGDELKKEKNRMSRAAVKAIDEYCRENGISEEKKKRGMFIIKAVVYGTIQMISNGESENYDADVAAARNVIGKSMEAWCDGNC